ncbi:MAG TPA: sigma factor-like helix-turn-helix DNA-binding protein [Vicinamibacteria bacterium]|nr:sigma factor-like helix-turn-helix DNA-binding protein [Vicinamibacteria bacterium]
MWASQDVTVPRTDAESGPIGHGQPLLGSQPAAGRRFQSSAPINSSAISAGPDRRVAEALGGRDRPLPGRYRSLFVFREVEGLSMAETADCLKVSPETVKTRLLRARGLLREELLARAGSLPRMPAPSTSRAATEW